MPNRPTRVSIDLEALGANLAEARRLAGPGAAVLAMVKADAYGHGASIVAPALEARGAEAFGVAAVEEGIELRDAGVRAPVFVFCGTFRGEADEAVRARLTPVLFDGASIDAFAEAAARSGRRVGVHVKIDTGMGRLGVEPAEAEALVARIERRPELRLEGLCTHLARADDPDGASASRQVEDLRALARRFGPRAGGSLHFANSAALFALPRGQGDTLVRPGLMLYGAYPHPSFRERASLRPVLRWSTAVLLVKRVPRGRGLSYGRTFVTSRDSVIATVPVGYADGYPWSLSNRGFVLVAGRRAPVVGRVCMDLTLVDVTDAGAVRPGDEVVLLGRQGGAEIRVEDLAEAAGTLPYEILSRIGRRVPRSAAPGGAA